MFLPQNSGAEKDWFQLERKSLAALFDMRKGYTARKWRFEKL